MSDDSFWAGVFFGGLFVTVGAIAVHRFSNESYQRGWNGEQLIRVGPLGILGTTNTEATVLVASFRNGEYDREVKLTLNMQNRELQLVSKQVRQVSEELKRLETAVEKVAQPTIPVEKSQFLDDLYRIAQIRLSKKETRQVPSYSV